LAHSPLDKFVCAKQKKKIHNMIGYGKNIHCKNVASIPRQIFTLQKTNLMQKTGLKLYKLIVT
jgi:hypothetical protein